MCGNRGLCPSDAGIRSQWLQRHQGSVAPQQSVLLMVKERAALVIDVGDISVLLFKFTEQSLKLQ